MDEGGLLYNSRAVSPARYLGLAGGGVQSRRRNLRAAGEAQRVAADLVGDEVPCAARIRRRRGLVQPGASVVRQRSGIGSTGRLLWPASSTARTAKITLSLETLTVTVVSRVSST